MPRLTTQAFLMAALAALFWAGNAVTGKMLAHIVPPFSMNFWRWTFALLIILPWSWKQVVIHKAWFLSHLKLMAALSLLSITLYNALQYLALQDTNPANVGIVTATMPLWILLGSALLDNTKLKPADFIGLTISFAGVVAVLLNGQLNFKVNPGDAIMLFAVMSFSLYSVLLKRVPGEIPSQALLTVLIAGGVLLSLPLYLSEWQSNDLEIWLQPQVIKGMAYVVIFPALGSYFLWYQAVKRGGPVVTSLSINFLPVFASILAVWLLDDRISVIQILAMVMVFTGTFISLWSHNRQVLTHLLDEKKAT